MSTTRNYYDATINYTGAYSVSLLNTYFDCPWAALQKMQGKRERVGLLAEAGSMNHDIFARYAAHCLETGQQTDMAALPGITTAALAASLPQLAEEVEPIIESFGKCCTIPPGAAPELAVGFDREWRPLWCEPMLGYKAMKARAAAEDAYFVGFIDLAWPLGELDGAPTDGWGVLDYKTGWRLPPRSQGGNTFQTRTYAALLHLIDPTRCPIEVSTVHIRQEKVRGPSRLSAADLKAAHLALCRSIAKIEAETEWAPTPGSRCTYCDVVGCPEQKRAETADIPQLLQSKAAAVDLASRVLAMEGKAKKAKKVLATYCEAAGPVVTGDMEAGFQVRREAVWEDIPGIMAVLQAHGRTAEEILARFEFTNRTLAPLVGKGTEAEKIRKELEQFILIAASTSFGFKRKGGKK